MAAVSSFLTSTTSLAQFSPDTQTGVPSVQEVNFPGSQPGASVDKFQGALQRAQDPMAVSPHNSPAVIAAPSSTAGSPFSIQPNWQHINQAQAPSETVKTYGQMDADALAVEKNRALRGLDLEKSVQGTEAASSVHDSRGDTILDGLSRLRSTFDDQTARLGNISSQSMSGTEMLIATQVEVVKYSLLMDVTSKLTGKSTQTFDTLMKGQ
ncbi:hypothetical protein [Roseibium sp.]